MLTNPAHAGLHFDHLADHERAVHNIDRLSPLRQAVDWLAAGETTYATNAMRHLDDDALALAASIGVNLSILAELVTAERLDPFGDDSEIGGFRVGGRRAL